MWPEIFWPIFNLEHVINITCSFFFPATIQDWNLIPIKIRAESYLKFNFYVSKGLKAVLLNFPFY